MPNKKQKLFKELTEAVNDAKVIVSDYGVCLEKVPQVFHLITTEFLELYFALNDEEKREEIKERFENKNSRLYNRLINHYDENLLPHDKKTIKIALKLLIKMSKSDQEKEKYKTGLVLLKDFIDFQELEGK